MSRSTVIVHVVSQLVTNYPHIIAFCQDNSKVGTCPDPNSSSPCVASFPGSRSSESLGTRLSQVKGLQRITFACGFVLKSDWLLLYL